MDLVQKTQKEVIAVLNDSDPESFLLYGWLGVILVAIMLIGGLVSPHPH